MNPLESASPTAHWYVYLLVLADCSTFKVGFSCNPFHRAFAFSRRYFERFDLRQSVFARLDTCDEARSLEAAIKSDLAAHRSECPTWVPAEAGGQTEWFDAVHWAQAENRLRALEGEGWRLVAASEFVRLELEQQAASFEVWAVHQAQFIARAVSSSVDAHLAFGVARALRDWLDAFRSCDIELFADDPDALAFVRDAARQVS